VPVTLAQILRSLQELHAKVDILMTQQDDINTDVTTIEAGVTNLGTATAAIQAEIDALKAANPQLDLSGLDKAAADLTGAVSVIGAIPPPAA
jgi:hypothetical protein